MVEYKKLKLLTEFEHFTKKCGGQNIAGVDGCRGGWVAVTERAGVLDVCLCRDLVTLLKSDWDLVMIDMPIGLPEQGRRRCDREARKLLGSKRSSVFFSPTRRQVSALEYEEVRTQGVSLQSFYLFPKIREVDGLMGADIPLREAHPELAYHQRAAESLPKKRTAEGREARQKILNSLSSPFELKAFEQKFLRKDVGLDDLLDAAILLEVARDWLTGQGRSVGDERDSEGLKMEICF